MPPLEELLASRFEFKYLVPEALVARVRDFVQPFVRLDRYGEAWPQGRYPIYSLYLDSPELHCYHAAMDGLRDRYKLRIRSYRPEPEEPVFFEVKKRSDLTIRKHRAKAPRRAVHERGTAAAAAEPADDWAEFQRLSAGIAARPALWVRYWREAYLGRAAQTVRLNFDYRVEYAAPRGAGYAWQGLDWRPSGLDGVVYEFKFQGRCPPWAAELTRAFQLQRRSVCKYAASMEQHLIAAPVRRLER